MATDGSDLPTVVRRPLAPVSHLRPFGFLPDRRISFVVSTSVTSTIRIAVKFDHHNNIMEAVITINTDTPHLRNIAGIGRGTIPRKHFRHLPMEITLTIVD